MAIEKAAASGLTPEEERHLLALARAALEAAITRDADAVVDATLLPPPLRRPQATFVTLTNAGHLRGCVGHVIAEAPLYLDAMSNAVAAATHDYRFPAVAVGELPYLTMSISLLTEPAPVVVAVPDDLPSLVQSREDGLILELHGYRSVLLPEMWEVLPDADVFLEALCAKAGLPPDAWRHPRARLLGFQTAAVSDPGYRLEIR